MNDLTMRELLAKLYRGDADVEYFSYGVWMPVEVGSRLYCFLQKTEKSLTISEMADYGHYFRVRS